MGSGPLSRIVEHGNWANATLIRACASLTDTQLDTLPRSAGEWSIRKVLEHLVEAQAGYASLLLPGSATRATPGATLEDLARAADDSGRVLQRIADGDEAVAWESDLRTGDGYLVKPWTAFVQAINHGNDHRRQVCGILRELGVSPPRLDGWGHGEAVGAVVKP